MVNKMIKNIKLTIVAIVLMLFFSSFFVAVPAKASEPPYVSLGIRGAGTKEAWLNEEHSLSCLVENYGSVDAYDVTVIFDYDETNITITGTMAYVCYGNGLIYGTDDGDKVTWNVARICKPPRVGPDDPPVMSPEGTVFSPHVKYIAYNNSLLKGDIIRNKITVKYHCPLTGDETTSKFFNIEIVEEPVGTILGFNINTKIRKYNGDEIQWLNEKTVLDGDNVHLKINLENTRKESIHAPRVAYILPQGLEYVPGTSIANGKAKEPSVFVLPSGVTILRWHFPMVREIINITPPSNATLPPGSRPRPPGYDVGHRTIWNYTGKVDPGKTFSIEFDTTAYRFDDHNYNVLQDRRGKLKVWTSPSTSCYEHLGLCTRIINDDAIIHVEKFPHPHLSTSGSISFGRMQLGKKASKTFRIWNSGTGLLSYHLEYYHGSESWISLSPTSGECGEQGDLITVTIDTNNLAISDPNYDGLVIGKFLVYGANSAGYAKISVSVEVFGPNCQKPATPVLTVPTTGYIGQPVDITMKTTDPNNDQVCYKLEIRLGGTIVDITDWSDFAPSGVSHVIDYTFGSYGPYYIRAQAMDSNGTSSLWSSKQEIFIQQSSEFPCLMFSPHGYDFGSLSEGESSSISFDIWNGCGGTLSYSLSEDCDWLSLSSTEGESSGEHDIITVDVDTTELSEGAYTCDISISSNGGSGIFTVSLIVGDEENEKPTVKLLNPENGKLYIKDEAKNLSKLFKTIIIGPITIKADVIDIDGEISKVEFIINDELKQTLTSGPYEYYWNERAFGISYIKIKAYDDKGAVSEIEFDALVINLGLSK